MLEGSEEVSIDLNFVMADDYAFIGMYNSIRKITFQECVANKTSHPGLGAMGFAMAMNMRKKIPASSTLYINDINASSCERFSAEYSTFGPVKIVATAREAAENANVLISIVPGGADVKAVYLDDTTGVIAAKKNDERLMLECSTIDVGSTKEVGRRLKAKGLGVYIDAPVSVRTISGQLGRVLQLTNDPGRRACSRSWHTINAHRPPSTIRFIIAVFTTSVQYTLYARIPV
jgi:hypothetical protein